MQYGASPPQPHTGEHRGPPQHPANPRYSYTACPNLLMLLPLVLASRAAQGCPPPPARKEVSEQEHPHRLPVGILQGWSQAPVTFKGLLTFIPGSPGTPCKQQEEGYEHGVTAADMVADAQASPEWRGGWEWKPPVVLQVQVVQGSWQRMAALSPPCHSRQVEKRLSHICHQFQLIPPLHHRGDHLQIQPHSLALVVPGDRGVLVALGVPWAQEGQLTPFLLGLLLVLFLPCCPAKRTRKKTQGNRWDKVTTVPAWGLQTVGSASPPTSPNCPLGQGTDAPLSLGQGLCGMGDWPALASLILAVLTLPWIPVQCTQWPPEGRLK